MLLMCASLAAAASQCDFCIQWILFLQQVVRRECDFKQEAGWVWKARYAVMDTLSGTRPGCRRCCCPCRHVVHMGTPAAPSTGPMPSFEGAKSNGNPHATSLSPGSLGSAEGNGAAVLYIAGRPEPLVQVCVGIHLVIWMGRGEKRRTDCAGRTLPASPVPPLSMSAVHNWMLVKQWDKPASAPPI